MRILMSVGLLILGAGLRANEDEMVFLTVDKDKLEARLQTWPDNPAESKLIKQFRIAIGKESGDKQNRGDNRTPEGIYMTGEIIDGKQLPEKYGPRAITLNYPNPIDIKHGKTGSGIWLHGVIKDERVEEAKVTEGCVAFYNADITMLSGWLKPFQGMVIIGRSNDQINEAADLQALREATQNWVEAWRARDLETYISFYDPTFSYESKSKDAYKEYKGRIFASYKDIRLEINKMRVFTHPKYGVSLMDQDFYGDKRFSSIGRKILYWARGENGKWMITREVFEDKRVEFVSVSPSMETRFGSRIPPQNSGSQSL